MSTARTASEPGPRLGPRSLDTAVVLSVFAAMTVLLWRKDADPIWWLAVPAATEFAAAWALLRRDPRLAPNANPCLAAALLLVAANIGEGNFGPSWFIESLLNTVVIAPVALLLLRYPYPRLSSRIDRVFVIVVTGWTLGTQLVINLLWTPEPQWHEWWPTLVHGNHFGYFIDVADIGSACLAVIGLGLVARRPWRAHGPDRQELVPVALSGAFVAVAAGVTSVSYLFSGSDLGRALGAAAMIAYVGVPIAFLVVAVQRRLARARIAEFATDIGAPSQPATGPQGLAAAFRRALADPDLEIRYWVDDGYVDENGTTITVAADGRLTVPISAHDGTPLALLVTDPSLGSHRDLVDAAVAAAALALENARLHAAVLAQLSEVRAAQQRIVEAGLNERRRIERDLHDGAQQRLVAASITLARAHEPDAQVGSLLDTARAQVRTAIAELRDLARGIHPPLLTQSGLAAAVESLAEDCPLPVTLDIPPRRWPPAVESSAYFVIAEGLANVAKHAPAAHIRISVEDRSTSMSVEVADDGPGTAEPTQGSGLVGLADRVRAMGGVFDVSSVPGIGTRLTASIPCG